MRMVSIGSGVWLDFDEVERVEDSFEVRPCSYGQGRAGQARIPLVTVVKYNGEAITFRGGEAQNALLFWEDHKKAKFAAMNQPKVA